MRLTHNTGLLLCCPSLVLIRGTIHHLLTEHIHFCCTALASTKAWRGKTKGLTIDSQQTVVNAMLWCEDDELCGDTSEEDLQLARELLTEERALLKVVQQAQQWRSDGGEFMQFIVFLIAATAVSWYQ
jgi:hypothetical protein